MACYLEKVRNQALYLATYKGLYKDPYQDKYQVNYEGHYQDSSKENNTVTEINANVGDVAHLPCRFPQLSTLHQSLVSSFYRRSCSYKCRGSGGQTFTSSPRASTRTPRTCASVCCILKAQTIGRCRSSTLRRETTGPTSVRCTQGRACSLSSLNLHVNRPRAAILGPQELHVQEGDTFTLVCVIQQGKPPFVFWYHGEKMVNYDGSRNRLSVMTKVEGTRTHSRLTITDARSWDSGNYSCIPPNVEPSFVIVFVTEAGDTVAAVQRRGHSSAPPLLYRSCSSSTSGLLLAVVAKVVLTHLLPVR
ncbi:uncharacterized protein LOC135089416 [Scylla paramamosain]|uniref:uncharacterized protein LOC135089416 n=1 Tax=Scylla paramamosain TaxID=85552 RepID=UPI0030834D92